MITTDQLRQLICKNCHHPVFADTPKLNTGKDEKGTYVICSLCGTKNYLNKEKEK